jgi:hypothetical protein
MQMFQNLAAESEKRITRAITWSREFDVYLAIDSPGRLRHDQDAIAHLDSFLDVVS